MTRHVAMLSLLTLFLGAVLTMEVAGEETLSFPETHHGHVTVTWPKDHGEKPLPVLYWFHGTGGKPNPGLGRFLDHYVVIGMSYLKSENYLPGSYAQSHWELCLKVRRELEKKGHVFERNIVSGFSKGGWMSFYLGAKAFEELHGVAILGGGRDPNATTPPDLSGRDFAVLVGTGETDANYPNAQLAWRYFRKARVPTTYDEWLGIGHRPKWSLRLAAWFEVQRLKSHPEKLKAYCETEVEQIYPPLEKQQTVDAYFALRQLVTDPRFPHIPASLQRKIRQHGTALSETQPVKTWLGDYKKIRKLVTKEVDFLDSGRFDAEKLPLLLDRYEELAGNLTPPYLKARAAQCYRRTQKTSHIYLAQHRTLQKPENKALQDRFNQLRHQYTTSRTAPSAELTREVHDLGSQLSGIRQKAALRALFEGETPGNFKTPSPIEALLKSDPATETDANPFLPVTGLAW